MVRPICIAAALAVMASSSAFAAPITLNAGEQAFFNFDLTGVSPGPIYDEIRIETNLSGYEGDELGHWNFYEDFYPPLTGFIGSGALIDPLLTVNLTGVVDGIFSLQLVLLAGSGSSVTVDPHISGVTTVDGLIVELDIPPAGVPEPGTAALLGLGLAVLGRYRRKHAVC